MEQFNIFDFLKEDYKIGNKSIRLIELFAGIGAQSKALEKILEEGNLTYGFEHYKICEWAIPSILAYNEIHHKYLPNYGVDYSRDLSKDEIIDELFKLGVSMNYNEPAKLDQLKRQKEDKLRSIYNAIKSTNNLVDVSKVTGGGLGITNKDKYEYLFTYSFP